MTVSLIAKRNFYAGVCWGWTNLF